MNNLKNVAIEHIRLSGDNMREDVGDIDELSWSIRKHGILQPLLVTEREGGYLLVCGHRRLAAARRAGLDEVPTVVRSMTDEERFELMIVENVHRKHLSPLEEAHAFQKMLDKGITQVEIADRLGKSTMYVSSRMSLLKCEAEVQQRVHKGELSLYKAIDETRQRYKPRGGRPPETRDPNERWYLYYIDRLVGWLEAGRIPLQEDAIVDRLRLLSKALKSFSENAGAPKVKRSSTPLPAGVLMCEECGTVVGVSKCCDEHGDLCESCRTDVHEAA